MDLDALPGYTAGSLQSDGSSLKTLADGSKIRWWVFNQANALLKNYQPSETIAFGDPETFTQVEGVLTFRGNHNRTAPAWGGAAPVGVYLFLAQLVPGRIVLYRDFFSAFAARTLDRVEKALRDRLAAATELLPLSDLAAAWPKSARPPGATDLAPLLRTLLRHLPDALATRDDRAGLADRHAAPLLREILAAAGESPLRALVAAFNERVHPESRRGSGTLRDALRRDPLIHQTDPDRYALPAGLQTGLLLRS